MKGNKIKKTFWALGLAFFMAGCSTPEENPVNSTASNNLSLGSSAKDLLDDSKFTSLKIEVVYVQGFEPSAEALKDLTGFLGDLLHKPQGITVETVPIPSPGGGKYTLDQIKKIEQENRSYYNSGGQLSVYIFYADGKSSSGDSSGEVLGTAYKNTSMVIYAGTMRELTDFSIISRSELETSTLRHEFGHLLGLVDNGTPPLSDHVDPENKAHCSTSGCIMAASLEYGKSAMAFLKSFHTTGFGEHCLNDLQAYGGK